MNKKIIITTDEAPAAIGPYSQAVKAGDFIFASGQLGMDPKTGKLVDGGIEAQTHQVLKNIQALLKSEGLDCSHVVKATVLFQDLADFKTVNSIYTTYFPTDPPARTAFQVAALPLGALVEIEIVAHF